MLDERAELSNPTGSGSRSAPWTLDEIRQRFREAAWTIRRLPLPKNGKPQGWQVSWPDVVYDWLAYGWTPPRSPRFPPSPAEISRCDEVLGWLHWLTRDQRMLIWARSQAQKFSWRQLEALDELERDGHGRTERALRGIMRDGEERILSHLNGTPGRMRLKPEQLR